MLTFDRSDVIDKHNIRLHAHFPEDNSFQVRSAVTGMIKVFHYDRERTSHLCEMNEGWDGEENHRVYTSTDSKIVLEIWNSHNCETPVY